MLKEISLKGKTALITGGGTGIGFGIAKEMKDAGANIIIVGRRLEVLEKAAAELGECIKYYQFDLTDTPAIADFVKMVERDSPIDILVNNAGINIKKPFLDFTSEDFDIIVEIQAKATFMLTQEVAKCMKERRAGSIIMISSLSALIGMRQIQAYTMCKAGVLALARSLTVELAPYGIRINSLDPGFVYTDMLKNTNLKTPERLIQIQESTPMKRFATTKDLGMAAAFLASDAAAFITGVDLVVDGGISSSFSI